MEILTCENVVKTYGRGETRVEALRGVSLRVERGAFVAIVGASGSGKSTLLHLIAGVDKPTSGRVCVEGTDLATLDRTRSALFRRRRVAMVYQSYNLIPTLTARENLLLPLRLDRREAETDLFARVTRLLNIEDKLDRLPSQLSGGEQQRVAVARALLTQPALLLADEPTGRLDRRGACDLIDLLRAQSRALQQTVLLVTHDESLAMQADRVLTLSDGRLVGDERRG